MTSRSNIGLLNLAKFILIAQIFPIRRRGLGLLASMVSPLTPGGILGTCG